VRHHHCSCSWYKPAGKLPFYSGLTPVLFHIIFFSGQRLFHCLMLHVPSEMAVSFGLKITQQRADRFPMRFFAPAYTYTSLLPCIQMRTTRNLAQTAHPFKGHRQHGKLVNGERILYRPQCCCCKFTSSRVCVTYGNNRRWS
jgi:hypothetical protein